MAQLTTNNPSQVNKKEAHALFSYDIVIVFLVFYLILAIDLGIMFLIWIGNLGPIAIIVIPFILFWLVSTWIGVPFIVIYCISNAFFGFRRHSLNYMNPTYICIILGILYLMIMYIMDPKLFTFPSWLFPGR